MEIGRVRREKSSFGAEGSGLQVSCFCGIILASIFIFFILFLFSRGCFMSKALVFCKSSNVHRICGFLAIFPATKKPFENYTLSDACIKQISKTSIVFRSENSFEKNRKTHRKTPFPKCFLINLHGYILQLYLKRRL